MNIQKILEYQQKDFEIVKLQQELETNTSKVNMTKLSALAKSIQEKSSGLEKDAEDSIKIFDSLKAEYEKQSKLFKSLSEKDLEKLEEADYTQAINNVNNVVNVMTSLEKKLLELADRINQILSEYDLMGKKYKTASEQYKLNKLNYEKFAEKINPKIQEITNSLKTLETDIEPKILEKYKVLRQDKIFPVFVPVLNDSCGGCNMALPSAQIEKLNKDGFFECETCHRIIYKI